MAGMLDVASAPPPVSSNGFQDDTPPASSDPAYLLGRAVGNAGKTNLNKWLAADAATIDPKTPLPDKYDKLADDIFRYAPQLAAQLSGQATELRAKNAEVQSRTADAIQKQADTTAQSLLAIQDQESYDEARAKNPQLFRGMPNDFAAATPMLQKKAVSLLGAKDQIAFAKLADQAKKDDARIAQQNADLKERERHDEATERRAQQGIELQAQRESRIEQSLVDGAKPPAGYEKDPNNPNALRPIKGGPHDPSAFDPRMGDLMGALAEQGVSLPAGFRSKEQQATLYKGLLDRNPDLTPDEIASKIKTGQIEFGAQKKETQTAAGTAGKVEVAQNEIEEFVPLVKEAAAAVPRGKFVPLNRLMQTADSSISDPNLKALKIRINSVLNAYDMLAARGGTDKDKRAEVRNLITSADGPEALNAALDSFQKEAAAAHRAAVKATRVPELDQKDGGAPKTVNWDDLK